MQMNLLTKQKETHRQRTNLWLLGHGGIIRRFGMAMDSLLYLK